MPGSVELIADIGGSSSRWALLDNNGQVARIPSVLVPGFNPAVNSPADFVETSRTALESVIASGSSIRRITVYGAGCGTDERKMRMKEAVHAIVKSAEVVVHTDLLGAARGLCGSTPGLILILGTGMNAGWYDGHDLTTPMPSLGWILGDEGSGADIGKQLLNDAVHAHIPERVVLAVFGKPACTAAEALHIMRTESPNRAVASLAGRLVPVAREPYVQGLLNARFAALTALLDQYFRPHFPCSVSATGGIAYGFRDQLRASLGSIGLDLQQVEADPMEGLMAWHRAH